MRDITCPECNQSNTPGSKFCNNCGHRLPPSTEIICPNCQTPNAQHLFYCDNCGTRLVRSSLPTEVDSEPGIAPPASEEITGGMRDIFSLPTRKPGHTGKLDPNTLPHWLRTGEQDDDELIESDFFLEASPSEEPEKPELPDIEELVPSSKGGTGDLPDWLMSSNDSSAEFFMPPSDITTEAFLDMMDKEGEAIEQLLAGRGEEDDVDKLNLPDWLSDAVKETGQLAKEEPTPSAPPTHEEIPDIFQTSTNIPNWLAELGGIDTSDLQQSTDDKPTESEPTSVADWGQSEPSYEESPDWLNQFDEAESASEPVATHSETREFDLSSWGEPAIAKVELPEWYTELHALTTAAQDERLFLDDGHQDDGHQDDDHQDDGFEDAGFNFDDFADEDTSNEFGDFAADSEEFFFSEEPDDSSEEVVTGMLTDWLDDLEEEPTDSFTEQAPAKDDFFFAEDIEDDEAFTDDRRIVTSQLTGWLSELESEGDLTQAEADETEFSWDDSLSDDGFSLDEPSDEEKAVTGKLTGWLAQLDDAADDEEDSLAGSATFTDWFDTVDESAESAPAAEPLPDWLTDSTGMEEAEEEETADSVFDDLFTTDERQSASDFDMADWMSDEEEEATASPPFDEAMFQQEEKPAADDRFTTEAAIAEDMPDWLDELGPSGDTVFPSSSDEDVGVTDWLQGLDGGEETASDSGAFFTDSEAGESADLDWLMEEDEVEEEVEEEEITAVVDEDIVPEVPIEPDSPADVTEPDWFSELSSMDDTVFEQPGAAQEPAAAEVDFVDEDEVESFAWDIDSEVEEIEEEETAVADDVPSRDGAPSPPGKQDEPSDVTASEELPDWFSQLGDIQEKPANKKEQDLLQNEDLPDWLSNMKPEVDSHASSLPGLGSVFGDSLPDSLQEIPAELTGADLPDWLQGLPTAFTEGDEAGEDGEGSDAWLKLSDSDSGQKGGSAAQLRSILSDLPPPRDPKADLAKAKIPEWLDALKPKELTGEAPVVPEQPEQKQGALVGIRGVIEIEPIITEPHAATPLPSHQLNITQEQQQQAMLLRQLAKGEASLAQAADTESGGSPALTRAFLVILIFIIMGVLVFLPTSLIKTDAVTLSPAATAAQETISSLGPGPILIAFDYTPALGGELDKQAQMLMAELTANGHEIIAVSQYAAGTAVAQSHTSTDAYFIPGEAIGLRQVGNCLADGCTSLFGRSLSSDLSQVQLVIILTGERSSLINWVEQVGLQTQAPLIAGTTQALEPVALSYVDGGQLAGALNYLAVMEGDAETAVNAQTAIQLLLVIILLVALLFQMIRHRRGQAKQVRE